MLRIAATALLSLTASAGVLAVPPPPSAAPPAKTIAADDLVGRWYVEPARQDGVLTDTVVTRNKDRSIVLDFRFCDGGKLLTYAEEGTWSVFGDLYLARTHISRTADGAPPDGAFYEERYRIEEVLPDRLIYRGIGSRDRFESKRVPQDFAPPADLCASPGEHPTAP